MSFPQKLKYWATDYGRKKLNNEIAQAKNKIERVSKIMKVVIENEDKNKKIKVIKSLSYGIKKFDNLKKLIQLRIS